MNQFKWLPMEIKPLHSHTDTHFHQGVCVWVRATTTTPIKKHGQGRGMCRSFLRDQSRYNEWHADAAKELAELMLMKPHTNTNGHVCTNKPDTHRISQMRQKKKPIKHVFKFVFFFIISSASWGLLNWVVNHQNNKLISSWDVRTFMLFYFFLCGKSWGITMA